MLKFQRIESKTEEAAESLQDQIRFQVFHTACCHFCIDRISPDLPVIDKRLDIYFFFTAFRLLENTDFRLSHKPDKRILPVRGEFSFTERGQIICTGKDRHSGHFLLIGNPADAENLNALHAGFVHSSDSVPAVDSLPEFYVKIFSVAGQSDAKRIGKGHDHMGTVSCCKCDRNISPTHNLLKKTHDIKMSDKAECSVFSEFNSCFHNRHLLQILLPHNRNTASGSSGSQFLSWHVPILFSGISG